MGTMMPRNSIIKTKFVSFESTWLIFEISTRLSPSNFDMQMIDPPFAYLLSTPPPPPNDLTTPPPPTDLTTLHSLI